MTARPRSVFIWGGGRGGGEHLNSANAAQCDTYLLCMARDNFPAVLLIRDVYPRSRILIFPFWISVPGTKRFGSQILIRVRVFKYFLIQKNVSRLSELWSGMFIPDPRSRIKILIFSPILDSGSRGQKGTGIPDPDPQSCFPDRYLNTEASGTTVKCHRNC